MIELNQTKAKRYGVSIEVFERWISRGAPIGSEKNMVTWLCGQQRKMPAVREWLKAQGVKAIEIDKDVAPIKNKEPLDSAESFRNYYSLRLEQAINDNDLMCIKFWNRLFIEVDESIRMTEIKSKRGENKEKLKADRNAAFEKIKRVLSKGDVREDGLVFWSYSKSHFNSNFEHWVTSENFNEYAEKDKARCDKRNPPSARQLEIRKKKKELTPIEFKRWKRSTRESTHKRKTDPIEIQKSRDMAKRNYERIKGDPVAFAKFQKRKKKAANKRYHKTKNDPQKIIERSLRSRLGKRMKSNGTKFTFTYCEMIGCTPDYAQKHIEKQFTKKMSWKNYASYWEIDHIRPLASFNLEIREEALAGNHYTNLQPLSKKENNKKSDKWDGQTEMLSQIL